MCRGQCQKFPKGYKFTVAVKRTEFISPLQAPGDKHTNGTQPNICLLSVLPFVPIYNSVAIQRAGRDRRKRRKGKAVSAVSLRDSELKSRQLMRPQYRYRIVFTVHGHIRNISGVISIAMEVLQTANLHN